MKLAWRLISLLPLLLAVAIIAIADQSEFGAQDLQGRGTDLSGEEHKYVVSEMHVPSSSVEAVNLGLDVDGDGGIDNTFGQFLASFGSTTGLDFQAAAGAQVQKGTVIHLLSFRTSSFSSDDKAALWIFKGGNPSTAPCVDEETLDCGYHLDGETYFEIVPEASTLPMAGSIISGEFTGGPGSFQLALPFLGRTMPIYLIGAHSKLSGTSTAVTGKMGGGGITGEVIDSTVYPVMTEAFSDIVAEDCTGTPETGCCDSDSSGESLIQIFDVDPVDCKIFESEVRNNELLSTQLQPDIDLLDENGNFNPGQDGINDSVSIGVGFDSVGAEFKLEIFTDSFES